MPRTTRRSTRRSSRHAGEEADTTPQRRGGGRSRATRKRKIASDDEEEEKATRPRRRLKTEEPPGEGSDEGSDTAEEEDRKATDDDNIDTDDSKPGVRQTRRRSSASGSAQRRGSNHSHTSSSTTSRRRRARTSAKEDDEEESSEDDSKVDKRTTRRGKTRQASDNEGDKGDEESSEDDSKTGKRAPRRRRTRRGDKNGKDSSDNDSKTRPRRRRKTRRGSDDEKEKDDGASSDNDSMARTTQHGKTGQGSDNERGDKDEASDDASATKAGSKRSTRRTTRNARQSKKEIEGEGSSSSENESSEDEETSFRKSHKAGEINEGNIMETGRRRTRSKYASDDDGEAAQDRPRRGEKREAVKNAKNEETRESDSSSDQDEEEEVEEKKTPQHPRRQKESTKDDGPGNESEKEEAELEASDNDGAEKAEAEDTEGKAADVEEGEKDNDESAPSAANDIVKGGTSASDTQDIPVKVPSPGSPTVATEGVADGKLKESSKSMAMKDKVFTAVSEEPKDDAGAESSEKERELMDVSGASKSTSTPLMKEVELETNDTVDPNDKSLSRVEKVDDVPSKDMSQSEKKSEGFEKGQKTDATEAEVNDTIIEGDVAPERPASAVGSKDGADEVKQKDKSVAVSQNESGTKEESAQEATLSHVEDLVTPALEPVTKVQAPAVAIAGLDMDTVPETALPDEKEATPTENSTKSETLSQTNLHMEVIMAISNEMAVPPSQETTHVVKSPEKQETKIPTDEGKGLGSEEKSLIEERLSKDTNGTSVNPSNASMPEPTVDQSVAVSNNSRVDASAAAAAAPGVFLQTVHPDVWKAPASLPAVEVDRSPGHIKPTVQAGLHIGNRTEDIVMTTQPSQVCQDTTMKSPKDTVISALPNAQAALSSANNESVKLNNLSENTQKPASEQIGATTESVAKASVNDSTLGQYHRTQTTQSDSSNSQNRMPPPAKPDSISEMEVEVPPERSVASQSVPHMVSDLLATKKSGDAPAGANYTTGDSAKRVIPSQAIPVNDSAPSTGARISVESVRDGKIAKPEINSVQTGHEIKAESASHTPVDQLENSSTAQAALELAKQKERALQLKRELVRRLHQSNENKKLTINSSVSFPVVLEDFPTKGNARTAKERLESLKCRVFKEMINAIGKKSAEKVFVEYWACLSEQIDGTGGRNQLESFVGKFLKTKRLKKAHNRLILGILKRCESSSCTADDVVGHVPDHLKDKVKRVAKTADDHTLNFDSSILHSGSKQGMAPIIATDPPKSESSLAKTTVSLRIPGALTIDPIVRAAAIQGSLRVTETIVWLLSVAAKEYTRIILKSCADIKKAAYQGIHLRVPLPRPHTLMYKPKPGELKKQNEAIRKPPFAGRIRITSHDVHTMLTQLPMGPIHSLGGTVSRTTYESTLMDSFDIGTAFTPNGFEELQHFLVSKIFVPKENHTAAMSAKGQTAGRLSPHGGLGRGAKDLASLRARSSSATKKENASLVGGNVPGEEGKETDAASSARKGKGSGVKNLKAMIQRNKPNPGEGESARAGAPGSQNA